MTRLGRLAAGSAALAIGLLAGTPAAVASPHVTAAEPICVGVVVANAQLGGGSNDYCATVAAGSTGMDVLRARATALGRPQPREQNGLLCAIDGKPATGCGVADSNGGYDYWSYWHRPAGASGWSYSRVGADDYAPGNGSQEGWQWVQGQSEANAPRPPLVAFDQVCRSASTPPPAPSSSAPRSSPPHSTQPPPQPTGPVPETALPQRVASTPGQPPATATLRGSGPVGHPSARTSAARPTATVRAADAPPTRRGSSAASAVTTPSPGISHLVATPTGSAGHDGGSSTAIAVAVGIAIIAGLGGAALWRARSR